MSGEIKQKTAFFISRILAVPAAYGVYRLLSIVLLVLSCLTQPATAEVRTVMVGIYENAPKVFTSESGRPSGIFVDVLEEIAKKESWELRYVPGTWAEGLDRLAKGEIDLMPDVAYTAEREKLYSFHKVPVLSVWSQVYAPRGSGIQSILDLNGKRIAALERTIQLETFRRLTNSFGLKITLIPVPDYKTEFEMVAAGKADAGLTNRLYGLMYARKSGLEDTPIMFDPAPFFFAAPRNASRQLLDVIDRRLSELKQDHQSAYYASINRWTSEEVQFKVPAWLGILGLVLGVTLLLSLAGSFILKHQVNARTRELKLITQEREQRIAERTLTLQKMNAKLQQEIEERARIEKALVASEAKYRDIVEGANSVIMRWTPEGRITFFNTFAQNFFGYPGEEILGRNIAGTIVPVQDSVGHDLSSLARDIAARPEAYAINENENIRKNKDRVWVTWTNRPIRDDQGRVVEILSIGVDSTKRVQAEKELRCVLEDLAAAKERAEQADRLKSAFLATMSHELRTPLNSIIGFTGILRQGLAGPLNDEQRKQLEMVQQSSEHLLDLINDVLDISKIEAGQLQVGAAPFDLKASILKIVRTVQPLARKKGLELTVSIAEPVGVIISDQRRAEQILLNLLSNAIKYTEKGQVRVDCSVRDGFVRTEVGDTGIGIREEDMLKLFRPFHQVETGLTRRYEGTGLGLSICKRLVELLGGKISAESEPGRGSTFCFTLPLKKGAS
ncbi:MAG: hypothetical protein A2010_03020 [Nitrospirae bacterium GWD2_57_9]|nr:MAG: hypothetical protein A2010_03020 [Nitrospirae bacterium GWD2_57_9]